MKLAYKVLLADFFAGKHSLEGPLLALVVSCVIGRMLRLTSLAPDMIEAILRGDEPDGMSLEKLRKDLPVRWEEQRRLWRVRYSGRQHNNLWARPGFVPHTESS